jgi:hypothetical protein
VLTAVVFGARLVRFGQLAGRVPANVAARTYHGRYLTGTDFDQPARALLRRAQDAIDAVTGSEVCRVGLLDDSATILALAEQEWDIAVTLREHGQLRGLRSRQALGEVGPRTAEVRKGQADAARLADASIAARVAELERYAGEVRSADAAYQDWLRARALTEDGGRHQDMLARTAADEHGVAEIDALCRQARAVRLVLGELSLTGAGRPAANAR